MTATVIPLYRHEPTAEEIWRQSVAMAGFIRSQERSARRAALIRSAVSVLGVVASAAIVALVLQ